MRLDGSSRPPTQSPLLWRGSLSSETPQFAVITASQYCVSDLMLRLSLPSLRVTKLKYDPSNLAILALLATAKMRGNDGKPSEQPVSILEPGGRISWNPKGSRQIAAN